MADTQTDNPPAPPPARARPLSPLQALALSLTTLVITLSGAHYLYQRWANLDRAVFEADVYAQGMAYALHQGSFWPWILTEEFWPFLTMAPGLYLFLPLAALAPGGYPLLLIQCLAVTLTAPLITLLALRSTKKRAPSAALSWGAVLLGIAWLVHPVSGVGMAWGWCFYLFGGPLLLLGYLLLEEKRYLLGGVILLLAASMKVNVALAVAGLGFWGMFKDGGRPWGVWVLILTGAWIALTGSVFVSGLMATGRLGQDLHLEGGPGPGWGGILTVLLTLLPILPFLRRTWPLALAIAGLEIAYTGLINPANSGLVGATAALFMAAALGVGESRRPLAYGAFAIIAGLGGQLLFTPPVVSPLPLTPGRLAYEVTPRGMEIRQWIDALGDDQTLVVSESLAGAIGGHPGHTLRAHQWDGRGEAILLLEEGKIPAAFKACLEEVIPASAGEPALFGGRCQAK